MEQKILSSGLVVVRAAPEGWRYLLLRCFRNWDFPKGIVERHEMPFDAAVREAAEETGITAVRFPWGKEYIETPPYSRGKVARFYLARTDAEKIHLGVNPRLGFPEHHEYRWMGFEEAERLLVPRLQVVLNWAHQRVCAGET